MKINIELIKEIPTLQLWHILEGLRVETKGYKITRRPMGYSSVNTLVKKKFGFKGNKEKIYKQFQDALLMSGIAYEDENGKLQIDHSLNRLYHKTNISTVKSHTQ
jgi:hypothetical protein